MKTSLSDGIGLSIGRYCFSSISMHGVGFLVWFYSLLQFCGRRVYRHEYKVTFKLVLVCGGVRVLRLEYKKHGQAGFGTHC